MKIFAIDGGNDTYMCCRIQLEHEKKRGRKGDVDQGGDEKCRGKRAQGPVKSERVQYKDRRKEKGEISAQEAEDRVWQGWAVLY